MLKIAHPEIFEGFGWMRLFVGIFVRAGLFLVVVALFGMTIQ